MHRWPIGVGYSVRRRSSCPVPRCSAIGSSPRASPGKIDRAKGRPYLLPPLSRPFRASSSARRLSLSPWRRTAATALPVHRTRRRESRTRPGPMTCVWPTWTIRTRARATKKEPRLFVLPLKPSGGDLVLTWQQDRKLLWKLDLKLIPWLTLLYLVSFLGEFMNKTVPAKHF